MSQSQDGFRNRLSATVGPPRLAALLAAYDEPRGAVVPLVILLRDAGVGVDDDVVAWIAQVCGTTAALVEGAISAYPELTSDAETITVCDGLTCRLMGAGVVQERLCQRLGADRVRPSACQNACSSAPVMQVRGVLYGALGEEALAALAKRLEGPRESA